MRRDCSSSTGEHPPTGLARLGQPFAIGWPAMPLGRTGDCLQRALAAIFCLRVLIASIWEENRCNRECHAVRHLPSCAA
ncbi:MAG: hypothetical protein ACK5Q6_15440 [Cyanobacteriota bacterium]